MTNEEMKRAHERYVALGGRYLLSTEISDGKVEARPVGWTTCPERAFVRLARCPNGFMSAWSWNPFTNVPVYVGKAPPPKPKPVKVARPVPLPPPVQRLESPEQRYFREHGNHPRAQDDVEIVMIKRGGGFNFGRFFFGNK